MSKILTITFSPSIDKSAKINALVPDKKMQCQKLNTEPGGGGINVARVISRLGSNVTAVFPSGGFTGMYFNHLLESENVPFVSIQTKKETRENFVILDETTNLEYRFGMPSNEIDAKELEILISVIDNQENLGFIIASGSLPPGIPSDIYEQLSKIAKLKNAKFIVDTSGDALKNALTEGVYLLKPNLEELGTLIGIKNLKTDNIEKAAKDLINENKIEIVVVSLGANGAMLATTNETYFIKPPKVKVKSTVGAGDSMVAGIVFGLSKNLTLKECLEYGIACGTATTINIGSALCEKKQVEKLLKIIKKQ